MDSLIPVAHAPDKGDNNRRPESLLSTVGVVKECHESTEKGNSSRLWEPTDVKHRLNRPWSNFLELEHSVIEILFVVYIERQFPPFDCLKLNYWIFREKIFNENIFCC